MHRAKVLIAFPLRLSSIFVSLSLKFEEREREREREREGVLWREGRNEFVVGLNGGRPRGLIDGVLMDLLKRDLDKTHPNSVKKSNSRTTNHFAR